MLTKTTIANKQKFQHKWYLVNAADQILGRLASKIAMVLMGKHQPVYTAHVDTGDFVVVVNAEKVKVTGKKLQTKRYMVYSGYSDGMHLTAMTKMMDKHPEKVVELAVQRMVPQTKLGKQMMTKLKIFRGPNHTHQAQQPVPIEECRWWQYFDKFAAAKAKAAQSK